MKKIMSILTVITLMMTLFISCRKTIKDVDIKTETPPPSEQQGSKKIIPNNIGELNFTGGIGFGFEIKGVDGFDRILKAERDKDVDFILYFSWESNPVAPVPVSFNLGIYIDYEQVDFFVDGSTNKVRKHLMHVNNNQKLTIPITIPADYIEGNHKLMIVAEYAEQSPSLGTPSQVHIVNLVTEGRTSYKEPPQRAEAETILDSIELNKFLMINQHFDTRYVKGRTINSNPRTLTASAGELVPIAARFASPSDRGILILTLEGEQVEINNNKYLYFENAEKAGHTLLSKFTVKAPEEKGEYIVNAYYIISPFGGAVFEISPRLKLVVE